MKNLEEDPQNVLQENEMDFVAGLDQVDPVTGLIVPAGRRASTQD